MKALKIKKFDYAISSHAPPASLIFFSASFENSLALTITGTEGNAPFPNTLKYPDFVTSITAAFPSLALEALSLVYSDTSDHILSILIVGLKNWFLLRWKNLIPFFPMCPG